MRTIDMKTWGRAKHFKLFNSFDHPHFNMCANMDVTAFQTWTKKQGASFTIATMYMIARTANAIPEFRLRIRPGTVVIEHEMVHPSVTILTREDLFSFCTVEYSESFRVFAAQGAERMAYVREHMVLENEPARDDMLYMSAIPWISFTSFMHPMNLKPADSIPRFAWGKYFQEGERLLMPLSVQGHHALMDGIHMARFYTTIQEYLRQPEAVLDH